MMSSVHILAAKITRKNCLTIYEKEFFDVCSSIIIFIIIIIIIIIIISIITIIKQQREENKH